MRSDSVSRAIAVLRLAGRVKSLSIDELCAELGFGEEECSELLEELVAAGVMNRLRVEIGSTYYALTPDPRKVAAASAAAPWHPAV